MTAAFPLRHVIIVWLLMPNASFHSTPSASQAAKESHFTASPVAFSTASKSPGAGPSIGNSPMPFAPKGPYAYRISSKKTRIGGMSARSRHDVVGHLVIRHAAVLPHDALEQSPTNPLRHSAFNLSGRQHRIESHVQLPAAPQNRQFAPRK